MLRRLLLLRCRMPRTASLAGCSTTTGRPRPTLPLRVQSFAGFPHGAAVLHCRLQDIRGLSSPGGQAGIHREAWHSGKNGFTLISVGCTRALRPYDFCSCDHVGKLADALSKGRISASQISATTKIPLHVSPSVFCSFNPRSALLHRHTSAQPKNHARAKLAITSS